ncbi:hypothetical protein ABZ502_17385 [Streptomyces abikoensis]|uniref:hypothetical protein n=1 Tax=Streptomyces abikoensis TaxID=97398 RepID=UPI0033D14E19
MTVSRTRSAAQYLTTDAARVLNAVCGFVGTPAPTDPLARRLATATLDILDAVPLGTLAVHDLAQTAGDWPALPITVPPTPWQAATLVDSLADLVRPLTATELRTAAAGFALCRADLYLALIAEERERAYATAGDGPVPTLGESLGAGRMSRESWEDLPAALRDTPPEQWTDAQCAAVRKALLEHLAMLGDGLLRVTEHAPAPLPWHQHDERRYSAAVPVPRSPHRLEARLRPEPPREPALPGADQPLWPGPPPVARAPWRWQVGWSLPDGDFIAQASMAETTHAAAVFAAEQTVVEHLAAAPVVRQRFTGRLLVPRPDGTSASDPALRVITLRVLLQAISAEAFDAALTTDDLVAAIFDALQVPYPHPGDTGVGEQPGQPAFDRFVASHAIVFTPPAQAYLHGIAEAARDSLVRDHHAAGLRRAFAMSSGEESERIVADLGPLPFGMAWFDLFEREGLEEFLDSDQR